MSHESGFRESRDRHDAQIFAEVASPDSNPTGSALNTSPADGGRNRFPAFY